LLAKLFSILFTMQTGKNISKLAVISLAMAFIFACSSNDEVGSGGSDEKISEPDNKDKYKACVLGYRNPGSSSMACLRLKDGAKFPGKACESPGDYFTLSCPGNSNKICPMEDFDLLMYGEFGESDLWNCEWMEEFIKTNYLR